MSDELSLEDLQKMGAKPLGDEASLEELQAAGAKPVSHVEEKSPVEDKPDNSPEAKVRAALGQATYGFAPKILAGIQTAVPALGSHIDDKGILHTPPQRSFDENLKQEKALYSKAEQDNPGSAIIGGFLSPDPFAKAKAATALGKIGLGMAKGAGAGVLQALGEDTDVVEGGLKGGAAGGVVGGLGAVAGKAKRFYNSVRERLLAEKAGEIGSKAQEAIDDFGKRYDVAADKQAAKILKGEERVGAKAEALREQIKKKVYGEYVAQIQKAGVSPEQAEKILRGSEEEIKQAIEAEYRRALFGKHAQDVKALQTQIRNAEPIGAKWTPEQQETVDAAKKMYIDKAAETVDKGIPQAPQPLSPEAFKAEVQKRSAAAKAKALKKSSAPPPALEPELLDDMAGKRLEAMKASGLNVPEAPAEKMSYSEARRLGEEKLKELPTVLGGFAETPPAVHPQMDPRVALNQEGWAAAKDALKGMGQLGALSAMGYGGGGPAGAGGALGAALVARILAKQGLIDASKRPGAEWLAAGAGKGLATGAEALADKAVIPAALEAGDMGGLTEEQRALIEAYLRAGGALANGG